MISRVLPHTCHVFQCPAFKTDEEKLNLHVDSHSNGFYVCACAQFKYSIQSKGSKVSNSWMQHVHNMCKYIHTRNSQTKSNVCMYSSAWLMASSPTSVLLPWYSYTFSGEVCPQILYRHSESFVDLVLWFLSLLKGFSC